MLEPGCLCTLYCQAVGRFVWVNIQHPCLFNHCETTLYDDAVLPHGLNGGMAVCRFCPFFVLSGGHTIYSHVIAYGLVYRGVNSHPTHQ